MSCEADNKKKTADCIIYQFQFIARVVILILLQKSVRVNRSQICRRWPIQDDINFIKNGYCYNFGYQGQ